MRGEAVALGLDPGLATTGYGVVRSRGRRCEVLAGGVIETLPTSPRAARLREIHDEARALIEAYRPVGVAIEEVYLATNARTAMRTAETRGALLVAAAGLPVRAYSPLEVKKRITGYGRATKGQVQAMVKELLHLAETPRPDDVADALALALCCLFDLESLDGEARGYL
jgi:crossover junction endodeoxyribonuclease RuvC